MVTILLADPRELQRKGLHTLFKTVRIARCIEAATIHEIKQALVSYPIDLVVIHQSLITAIKLLPKDHFVIMAERLDIDLLNIARRYGARGYLQENPSLELLQLLLRIAQREGEKSFFLDPGLVPDLLDALPEDYSPAVDLHELTPTEREILYLLHDDPEYSEIAKRLSVAESTVRYHVHHITNKLGMRREQLMRLKLPKNQQKGEG
jgi:DNA-binding NarL/FixJ family response regulator